MKAELEAMFKAGFIEACQWFEPVSNDVDSPALIKMMDERVQPTLAALQANPNPTHHAVIDEYGDIIYARRISGLLDAVEQCEYYIEQCRKDPVTRHSAKGWTVKEVTLHE